MTYYNMLYTTWWAQYEGMEQIVNFYSGLAPAGTNGEMVPSPEIALQQGRLEALEAAEKILSGTDILLYDWPDVQEYFVGIEGAMYPCGDWFYPETKEAFSLYPGMDIQFRRVPVISALGEKLGITDVELSLAVDYADQILAGKTAKKPSISPASLTVDEVLDAVVKARSVTQTVSYSHTVAANAWSSRLEHAKNFLRLMASDRGQEVFSRALDGTATLPYGFDISKIDWYASIPSFAKDRLEITGSADYLFPRFDLPLGKFLPEFSCLGAQATYALLTKNPNDRMTAQDLFQYDYAYFDSMWPEWMHAAGF